MGVYTQQYPSEALILMKYSKTFCYPIKIRAYKIWDDKAKKLTCAVTHLGEEIGAFFSHLPVNWIFAVDSDFSPLVDTGIPSTVVNILPSPAHI